MIAPIGAALNALPKIVWQIGTAGALLACVALFTAWQIEAGRADDLDADINDPATGYVVKLATCRLNGVTLQSAIDRQNEAMADLEAEAEERLSRSAEAVRRAQEGRAEAERRAGDFVARPIQGATVCERVQDVDRAMLDDLRRQER